MAKSGPPPRVTHRSQMLAPPQTSGRAVALTALTLIGPLLMAVLALGVGPAGRARARATDSSQAAGVAVTYPAGWNLVAFPPGTDLSQLSGPFYTYLSSEQSYETVQPDQALLSGMGFWVYFAMPTTVVLSAGSTAATSAGIFPGQWVMLGDPSGTKPAVINQDAIAYTYDSLNGYQRLTRLKSPGGLLLPGRGVWVTLTEGVLMAPTITPNPLFPDLTNFSLTSPCGAALATQGYIGEGSGEVAGEVGGKPVHLCRASGPTGLLVGDRLTTLDGGPACSLMERVVQEDANLFLVVGHVSATEESVGPLTWNGSGFQSNPANAYIACPSDITRPVASADQCFTPRGPPPSAPSLPVITLPVQSCPGFPAVRTSSATEVSVAVSSGGAQAAASLQAWGSSPNVLVGPPDFTCTAAYGSADGGLFMTLAGADDACALQPGSRCDYYAGPVVPTDRILAVFSPGGAVSPIPLACPYFASAQAGLRALPNMEAAQSSCASLPPGQTVQQLDANSVAFYQPADDAHASPTIGIVVSDVAASDGGTTGASTEAVDDHSRAVRRSAGCLLLRRPRPPCLVPRNGAT